MIVNKKSWHYRWNNIFRDKYTTESKNTLCSYFWYTVFNTLVPAGAMCLILVLFYLIGVDICLEYGWSTWLSVPVGIILYLVVGTVAGVLIGIAWGAVKLVRRGVEYAGDHKPEKASLVAEYLKAKKRKICPFIEFKE